MKKLFVLLFAAGLLLGGGGVVFASSTTNINSFNTYNNQTYNKYVVHKKLFKEEVYNTYVQNQIDDRRWSYGTYFNISGIPTGWEPLTIGIRTEQLGIFDGAVTNEYRVLVGLDLKWPFKN